MKISRCILNLLLLINLRLQKSSLLHICKVVHHLIFLLTLLNLRQPQTQILRKAFHLIQLLCKKHYPAIKIKIIMQPLVLIAVFNLQTIIRIAKTQISKLEIQIKTISFNQIQMDKIATITKQIIVLKSIIASIIKVII